jgi:small subunit ribosomal protein S6
MTAPAPIYDLVLLLDPQAEDAARAKLVADARAAIEAQGEFLRHDAWGDRALTYPIDRKTAAEYHLLQFHATTPQLLSSLDRSLRIADDVLRFRIVKLRRGVPDAPDMLAASSAARPSQPGPQGEAGPQREAGAEGQPEPRTEAGPEAGPQAEVNTEPEIAVGETS